MHRRLTKRLRWHNRGDVNRPFFALSFTTSVAVGCCAALIFGCAEPPPALVLVPSEMQAGGKHTDEANGGIAFWGHGGLLSEPELSKGPLHVTLLARGNRADGEWPRIDLELNGQVLARIAIESRQLRRYTMVVQSQRSGPGVLELSLSNGLELPGDPLAGRNVMIAEVILRQPLTD